MSRICADPRRLDDHGQAALVADWAWSTVAAKSPARTAGTGRSEGGVGRLNRVAS